MPTKPQTRMNGPRRPELTRTSILALVLAIAGCSMSASTAFAQSGPLASVAVAATNIGDGTSVAISGAAAYRFNRVLALGVEVTAVPTLTAEPPEPPVILDALGGITRYIDVPSSILIYPPPFPTYRFEEDGGRAVIFTTNLRLEIPTVSARVLPYVVAGGGVATMREQFTLTVDYPDFVIQAPDGPIPISARRSVSQPISNSFNSLALTLGGGISFRWTDHLWVDGDLRYFALLADRDMHVSRFGGGLSYRF
jgi:Outer membrane protein beta-barrel domain